MGSSACDPGGVSRARGLVACSDKHGETKQRSPLDRHHDSGARVKGRQDLTWRRDADSWIVSVQQVRMFRVVPDEQFAEMWRVVDEHGHLSERANLARAKDAAASMALAILNRDRKTEETAHGGQGIASNDPAATPLAETPPDAPTVIVAAVRSVE
jgi:hypothetical protein